VLGSKALKIWLGKSLKRFDEIISVSPAAADFAQSAFGIKTKILPNMIDVRKMQTKTAIKPKHIVFLGRLVERKGIIQLLRAFKILKKNYPKARLTIGGDGPLRSKIEAYIKRHKLSDSVKLVGFVPEAVKPKLLASADVACFPSLYGESFGIVLLEAMASGANVVLGGNNPGYASVLGEKKDLLVNPKDSKEFAAHLQKFLTNKVLAAKLHLWQRKHIKKYDVAVVGPKIEDLYFKAIANRTKSRHN
jgi:phosphatidylinositol alpha-mannosyltransferase